MAQSLTDGQTQGVTLLHDIFVEGVTNDGNIKDFSLATAHFNATYPKLIGSVLLNFGLLATSPETKPFRSVSDAFCMIVDSLVKIARNTNNNDQMKAIQKASGVAMSFAYLSVPRQRNGHICAVHATNIEKTIGHLKNSGYFQPIQQSLNTQLDALHRNQQRPPDQTTPNIILTPLMFKEYDAVQNAARAAHVRLLLKQFSRRTAP